MVSVIIPTYKRAQYIERAIDSVLRQSYKDIELIIVDDNNPNTSYRTDMEKIMEKYKDNNKVFYIKHETNKNGAAARNSGLKYAKGDYITFLDDDDFFLKNRIENLVKVLNTNKEYDCAYTNVIKINNNKIRNIIYARKSGNLQYETLMQNSFLGTGSNIFLRRKAIDELKQFDSSFFRYQDLEFMVRFFRKFNIIAVNDFTVVKDEESRINGSNPRVLYEMLNLFFKKYDDDIKKYDDFYNIYYTNYNRLYNKITDKEIKNEIKNKMLLMNLKPKIKIKNVVLNKLPISRNIISILRGKILSKKIDSNIKNEIHQILKKENNYEFEKSDI